MTNGQREKLAGRLRKQVALIEKVCAAHGLSYQDLGERIAVTRDTVRKYAGGYQPASERVMELIAQLLPEREAPEKAAVTPEFPAASDTDASTPETTLTEKLLYVLEHGTPEEAALLRAIVEAAHRQASKRRTGRADDAPA